MTETCYLNTMTNDWFENVVAASNAEMTPYFVAKGVGVTAIVALLLRKNREKTWNLFLPILKV